MLRFVAVLVLLSSGVCFAQWTPVPVPSSANLLSVHALGEAVWISGVQGTVLRSADHGSTWTKCAVLPGAVSADLRALQAFDADTAIVVTAGKGDHSRLFRTADGCKSWTKVFTVPDPAGALDSLKRVSSRQMYALAEPVGGKFVTYLSQDSGATWFETDDPGLDAEKGETAVESTLTSQGAFLYFGTSGGSRPYVHFTYAKCNPATPNADCAVVWGRVATAESRGGLHSIAVRSQTSMSGKSTDELVAVGTAEDATKALAVFSRTGQGWLPADTPPAAPALSVAFDGATQMWIAVGKSGTDVSKDGGRHWTHIQSAAEQGWSAMSLPFAVGVNGAVGILDRSTLKR